MRLPAPGMFCTMTVGLPGNVLADVTGQHARVIVVTAGRREADHDGESLAFEIIVGARRGNQRQQAEQRQQEEYKINS